MKRTIRHRLRATWLRKPLVAWRHRGVGEHDVLLASYPKSGNTWVKAMLAEVIFGGDMSLDMAEEVVPKIGSHQRAVRYLRGGGRVIKTHECFRAAYLGKRSVLLVRDGRDVLVSYYYYQQREGLFTGPFDSFFELFMTDRVDGYGGSWMRHSRSWLAAMSEHRGEVMAIRYEDIVSEPVQKLMEIVDYIGKPVSEQIAAEVVRKNSVAKMRRKEINSQVAMKAKCKDIPFVRFAGPGEWRTVFSARQSMRFWSEAGDLLERFGYE